MSNLSFDTDDSKKYLKQILVQIAYLNNLDKSVQRIFGQTEESPLDKPINDLLDIFLYYSGAKEKCINFEIDEIVDIIFTDENAMLLKTKLSKIMDIVEKVLKGK